MQLIILHIIVFLQSVKINAAYWLGIQDRPGALMRSADMEGPPTSEQLTLYMLKFC
jgi:hypothetical protein